MSIIFVQKVLQLIRLRGLGSHGTMSTKEVVDSSPLKVPATDVIDLTSDENRIDASHAKRGQTRDTECASVVQEDEDSDTGNWESESLYEDALEGIGDETLNGDGKSLQSEYMECR